MFDISILHTSSLTTLFIAASGHIEIIVAILRAASIENQADTTRLPISFPADDGQSAMVENLIAFVAQKLTQSRFGQSGVLLQVCVVTTPNS
uniref:Uncharacterized protein n=1 Tax=Romanomermis culicivorax TaxID=13658 RepID=A0A915IFB1_ROMCU